ncbi:3-keto-5-aminohexanoate cleavage protein [Brevibacterium ammoniilyticum]|uniref:3-keto-5-aminohexanoate cleavage protein n=1 Tax=Brevibacterium ammoniilyticum TaxID=1046555 RepID=A0ABP9U2C3_9MICO
MIKVCVNGPRTPSDHVRISPDPIIAAAEAAAGIAAGAEAVHVHPKSTDGRDSLRGVDLDRFVVAMRQACPGVPVGVTSGAWAAPAVADRLAAIASWTVLPDFVSLNWHEEGADDVAALLRKRGIGIEAGIWHTEGLAAWVASPHRSACLRALVEIQAGSGLADAGTGSLAEVAARQLADGVIAREPGLPVLLHGEDEHAWPMLRLAFAWGMDTRIGLEDTLVLPDGTPADGNGALVAAAVELRAAVTGQGKEEEVRRRSSDPRRAHARARLPH